MKRKIKITLILVTSLDGKTTKEKSENPIVWSSAEDQQYFQSQILRNNLIVMGRVTYQAAKPMIKLEEGKRRIVMTRHPKDFKKEEVSGKVEFSSETPGELVEKMGKEGYKNLLLVGGSSVSTQFLKAKLIDEIWLTIEPKIFGVGRGLVDEIKFDVQLSLLKIEKLNKNGTLLLKYEVK